MRSPFPGMDPYLEKDYWHEVHQGLAVYAADALQQMLPARVVARLEQRQYLEFIGANSSGRRHGAIPGTETRGEDEPVLIYADDEPLTESYIEIVDAASGNRVVTVVEFVSPTNTDWTSRTLRWRLFQNSCKRAHIRACNRPDHLI